MGYDGVHDGIEWVAFSPSQVKSATENIGTFDSGNGDIRYSIRMDDNTDLRKSLLAQNERYEKALKKAKEKIKTLREETYLTHGKKVEKKAVRALITRTAQENNARADIDGLTARLEAAFNEALKTGDTKHLQYEVEGVVREIMDGSRDYNQREAFADAALKSISKEPIYFGDVAKSEAAYISGSYQEYRNGIMGYVTTTSNPKALDPAAWAEYMIEKHPELRSIFPDAPFSDTDVVDALPDVINMLKNAYANIKYIEKVAETSVDALSENLRGYLL